MKNKFLILVVALSVSGCATILDGGDKAIMINSSNNKKVKVEVHSEYGVENIVIPKQYRYERSAKNLTVKVVDKCYEKTNHIIESEIANVFWVNFIAGGVIGTIIDSSTGNMWDYDEQANVIVDKKSSCK